MIRSLALVLTLAGLAACDPGAQPVLDADAALPEITAEAAGLAVRQDGRQNAAEIVIERGAASPAEIAVALLPIGQPVEIVAVYLDPTMPADAEMPIVYGIDEPVEVAPGSVARFIVRHDPRDVDPLLARKIVVELADGIVKLPIRLAVEVQ